jgi:methyltransferase (TIGR00027 family)
MQKNQPSRTAEATAFQRATERQRPARQRIVDDPWAEQFLRPALRAALAAYRSSGVLKIADDLLGLTPFVVTRHRYIDDRLDTALRAGVEQVVVLGAGYDSRAFRFADRLGVRPVFEVDHPATQARKERILRALGKRRELPRVDVRRVSIDFQRQSLEKRLDKAGFDHARSTFFIWEGVSMYLTREAVKATLGTLAHIAPAGSELVFDAWFLLDEPDLRATAYRLSANLLHFLGEPVTFSLHPEDAEPFLARQGFALREIARAHDLERRYARRPRRHVHPACYLVHAEIA